MIDPDLTKLKNFSNSTFGLNELLTNYKLVPYQLNNEIIFKIDEFIVTNYDLLVNNYIVLDTPQQNVDELYTRLGFSGIENLMKLIEELKNNINENNDLKTLVNEDIDRVELKIDQVKKDIEEIIKIDKKKFNEYISRYIIIEKNIDYIIEKIKKYNNILSDLSEKTTQLINSFYKNSNGLVDKNIYVQYLESMPQTDEIIKKYDFILKF